MRKSLLLTAVLGALYMPSVSFAEDVAPAAAEPASPHTFTYNMGLYSQYIFRGLTQTSQRPAIQGGMDYSHSSGLYAGVWGSNISWLEDGGVYQNSSLEFDIYGGYASTIGDTGLGYNVGVLQYIYPGDMVNPAFRNAETTEVYGALSYKWLQAKVSVVASNGAFGLKDADGSYYAELNANYPIGESGYTVNAHVGRQDFSGKTNGAKNDLGSYTDYKLGLTKSFSNGVNVGGYYTDTNGRDSFYGDALYAGGGIADDQVTLFVQKTF